jgi:hypothetical protein
MLAVGLYCNIIFVVVITLEMFVTNQFKRGNLSVWFSQP